VAGRSLKEAGLAHWNPDNYGATNSSGFTALPGGVEDPYLLISAGLGNYGQFWAGTLNFDGCFILGHDNNKCYESWPTKQYGFSVRCIRD
jgi:uncharacterized protein (TIGR02145 family)